MPQSIRTRLQLISLNHFLTGFILWYSLDKAFQSQLGISSFGTALIAVSYTATGIVGNVPTGLLADRWSRRGVMIAANVCMVISTLLIGLAQGIGLYILANIFWGLFYTSNNGSQDAFVYDTLAEAGQSEEFARIDGRNTAYFWGGLMGAAVVSAQLSSLLPIRTIILLGIVPTVVNILLLSLMKEPKLHKQHEPLRPQAMVRASIGILHQSPAVITLVSTMICLGIFGWSANEFSGLLFLSVGFGVYGVSMLEAVKAAVTALAAYLAHKVTHQSLWPLFSITCALLLSIVILPGKTVLGGFMTFLAIRSLTKVVGESRLHKVLPSHLRATAFSAYSLIVDLINVPLFLMFGWIASHYSIRYSYLMVLAAGLGIIAIGSQLRRNHIRAAESLV